MCIVQVSYASIVVQVIEACVMGVTDIKTHLYNNLQIIDAMSRLHDVDVHC